MMVFPTTAVMGQVICLMALGFLNPTFQPFLSDQVCLVAFLITDIHCLCCLLQFGLNELQVGLVFICGPAMYMILALVFGALADKYVRKMFKTSPKNIVLCLKGKRGFIVSGFIISGVAFFFVGPAHFITRP